MSLRGSGLNSLMPPAQWPPSPVAITGLEGTGKRTWVEHIISENKAVHTLTYEPKANPVPVALARKIVELSHRPTSEMLWVNLRITPATVLAQNVLLKTLEELPAHMRVLLHGTRDSFLPTVLSRCMVLPLTPPTLDEQIAILLEAGVDTAAAETVSLAYPRQPGKALALAKSFDGSAKADALLAAAENYSIEQIAAVLTDWKPESSKWLRLWFQEALLGTATKHTALKDEAGTILLEQALTYLDGCKNSKLGARAAATILASRER